MPGMRQRVWRNLRVLGGGSAFASLLSLLATVINSRALSIVDLGTFILLQSSALLLIGLATLSTQQPIIKMGVAALHAGDTKRFEGLVALGLLVDLASALVAGTLGLFLVFWLPDWLGIPENRIAPAAIVAGSLFLQGYKTSEGIFRAFNRFDMLARTLVAVALLQLAAAVLLWALDAPFIWYGGLAAMVLALPSVLQLLLSLRLMRQHGLRLHGGALKVARRDRREFAWYCSVTGLTGSLDSLRMNADTMLIGVLISIEGAGLYGVAKQLAGVVRKGTVIYSSVLFPEIAAMSARNERQGISRILRSATQASFAATAVLIGGTWLLGELALSLLFGEQFTAAHSALNLLIVAAGLQVASATYSMALQAFIRPIALLYVYLFASFVFLAAVWPGLIFLGLPGAGFAQILFVIALGAACALLLRREGVIGGVEHAN